MKKLIIFDYDGTLMDTIKDGVVCINIMLEKLNCPLINYEYEKGNELYFYEYIYKIAIANGFSSDDLANFMDEFCELYFNHPKPNTKPFKGIIEMLKRLNDEGYLIAISSNKSSKMINYFNDKFFKGIDFIDVNASSNKPDPSHVLEIIRNANVDLDDVVYVGDSITDLLTCRNAEIDCILVSWGQISFDYVSDDILMINKPSEIFKYII